jgi:hypothetical protein
LEQLTVSISPAASSCANIGLFLTQMHIFNWSAGICYKQSINTDAIINVAKLIMAIWEIILTGYIYPTRRIFCSTITWKSTSTLIPYASLNYSLSVFILRISSIFLRLSSLFYFKRSISSKQFDFLGLRLLVPSFSV